MKTIDITECIAEAIESKIIKEWKHEGYIDGMQSDNVFVVIDGKTYCIKVIYSGFANCDALAEQSKGGKVNERIQKNKDRN